MFTERTMVTGREWMMGHSSRAIRIWQGGRQGRWARQFCVVELTLQEGHLD